MPWHDSKSIMSPASSEMSVYHVMYNDVNVCLLCVVRAWNYGAMGAVMGHELSHAFDDQGSQYDKHGNLNNWWSSKSQKGFSTLKQCFIDQYSAYTLHGHNVSAVILYQQTKRYTSGKVVYWHIRLLNFDCGNDCSAYMCKTNDRECIRSVYILLKF